MFPGDGGRVGLSVNLAGNHRDESFRQCQLPQLRLTADPELVNRGKLSNIQTGLFGKKLDHDLSEVLTAQEVVPGYGMYLDDTLIKL